MTGSYKLSVQETMSKPGISWHSLCITKTQVETVPEFSL